MIVMGRLEVPAPRAIYTVGLNYRTPGEPDRGRPERQTQFLTIWHRDERCAVPELQVADRVKRNFASIRQSAGHDVVGSSAESGGKVRSFHGNFGVLVRAYAYILAMGSDGLTQATRMAVLNANYIRRRLEGTYDLASDDPCMHECVFSDESFKHSGVKTLDIAKRLLDYGFYAPTIYFPLVVSGALMIEPTETETKEMLDEFIDALLAIDYEMRTSPEALRDAPMTTPVSRLDETRAARRPVLRWGKG
jgi:glycine cleavage system protein P-like pyridoxal-binding family